MSVTDYVVGQKGGSRSEGKKEKPGRLVHYVPPFAMELGRMGHPGWPGAPGHGSSLRGSARGEGLDRLGFTFMAGAVG